MSKGSGIRDILDKLEVDESYTKAVKKPKAFTKIKDNVVQKEDHTHMLDLLMLPKTKEGFRYLLVAVDLASKEFDIEPLKTKQPKEVLEALKTMYDRNYINQPCCKISTDGGTEFKGIMKKWMYDKSILHKTAQPKRHSQMSMVESLNRQLGRLFNGYMNKKEAETGKRYKEWTDVVKIVRDELNKHRKVTLPKDPVYAAPDTRQKPKFEVGDVVYRLLDAPKDALGHDQPTENFRVGDVRFDVKNPRKITQVLIYNGKIPYRYVLEGLKSVSFTPDQLRLAKNEQESKYTVERIIAERTRNKKKQFLIKWKGYNMDQSTWEPRENLIEDVGEKGLKLLLDAFKQSKKK